MADLKYYYAKGRRKTSKATIRLFDGKGVSTVNTKPFEEYFVDAHQRENLLDPLVVVGLNPQSFHFTARTNGGGITGQKDSVRLALARALVKLDETYKKPLRVAGYLTRDPRMVERKKPGLHKARKAEQYSKR